MPPSAVARCPAASPHASVRPQPRLDHAGAFAGCGEAPASSPTPGLLPRPAPTVVVQRHCRTVRAEASLRRSSRVRVRGAEPGTPPGDPPKSPHPRPRALPFWGREGRLARHHPEPCMARGRLVLYLSVLALFSLGNTSGDGFHPKGGSSALPRDGSSAPLLVPVGRKRVGAERGVPHLSQRCFCSNRRGRCEYKRRRAVFPAC